MMKINKSKLIINPLCIGCQKQCNWRAATVNKDIKASSTAKYGCNNG